MGIMKKLGKSGMFGLAGLAATNKDITNKIARNGGLGLVGMALAKKKGMNLKPPQSEAGARRDMPAGMGGRPMMEDVMLAEEIPAEAPTMRKGGKVKKMAKGGSVSKRADGCAVKGKTKGRFV